MFYINGHFPAFDLVLDSFWVQYLAPVNFISSSRAILDPYPSFIKFKFQIWLIQSVIKNVPSVACCSNNWNFRFMYCRRWFNRSFSVAAFSKVFLSNKRFSFENNQLIAFAEYQNINWLFADCITIKKQLKNSTHYDFMQIWHLYYFSNSRLFSYEPLSYPFASSSKSENDFDNLFGESHFDLWK